MTDPAPPVPKLEPTITEPHSPLLANLTPLLARFDQSAKLLHEEYERARQERELMQDAVGTMIQLLEKLEPHLSHLQLTGAANARLEAELRESLASVHRMMDKLPGRRNG